MILTIHGDLNRSYAQTLCLIYFPGAKFAEDEQPSPDVPSVHFHITRADGMAVARVRIEVGKAHAEGVHREPISHWEHVTKANRVAAGAALLQAGTKMFNTTPSWGIMTGVRPAKVAISLIEAHGREGAFSKLCEDYFVTPKKASLLTDVAAREMEYFARYGEDTCSLYLSIPFCPTRCVYCSFVSYSTKRLLSLIPAYLDRLCEDIDRIARVIRESGKTLVTIYIGGGTPSILEADQLEKLLSKIDEALPVTSLHEYSIEAGRPDTVTPEKLAVCAAHGVTRVSINPQTLNDDVLAAIGRKHTVRDFYDAFEMARKSGIAQINTDLIAGLPGDSFPSFSRTVDEIMKLAPENITVHTFCVKKSADILTSGARIYSVTGGDTGICIDYSQFSAKANGYQPYYLYRQKNSIGNFENVGFAKPGTEGLYNMFIMEEVHDIYAVGAGAVTKLVDQASGRIDRVFMPKYPYEYLSMTSDAIDGLFSRIAGKKQTDRG